MTPEELHNIYRSESDFWWYRGMRAITRSLLDPLLERGVSRGLDAGCGTGFNALDLQNTYGLPMYGVDIARMGIQYARERSFHRSIVASITDLPFANHSFDFVSSIDVIVNLPRAQHDRALAELSRVLRPGGWLYLRVAAFRTLRSRHSQWTAEQYRFRAPELLTKLSALNLSIHRWTYANFFLSPIAFLKFRVWENIRKAPPGSGVAEIPPAWLNGLLTGILKAEAALIRGGIRLPFGQSLMVVARKPPQ